MPAFFIFQVLVPGTIFLLFRECTGAVGYLCQFYELSRH